MGNLSNQHFKYLYTFLLTPAALPKRVKTQQKSSSSSNGTQTTFQHACLLYASGSRPVAR